MKEKTSNWIIYPTHELVKILDGDCLKFIAVLMHHRNNLLKGKDPLAARNPGTEIQITMAELQESTGLNADHVKAAKKALRENGLISVREAREVKNGQPLKKHFYIINDNEIWRYSNEKGKSPSTIPDSIKAILPKKKSRAGLGEKKPKKREIIRQYIDITQGVAYNEEIIRKAGISASRALISEVLKDMRNAVNYIKPKNHRTSTDRALEDLTKEFKAFKKEVQKNINESVTRYTSNSNLNQNNQSSNNNETLPYPTSVDQPAEIAKAADMSLEDKPDWDKSFLYHGKSCSELEEYQLLNEIDYREEHGLNVACPKLYLSKFEYIRNHQ